MEAHALLSPVAVLILWSLIILLWMVITRFKAFAKAGLSVSNAPAGNRYVDVEPKMPAKVNWVSHNYTHLMEQPTLFYAVILLLVLAGDPSQLNLVLAWAYVGIRIIHSLWQILANRVSVRIVLFALSTICLLGLAVNAVILTLF